VQANMDLSQGPWSFRGKVSFCYRLEKCSHGIVEGINFSNNMPQVSGGHLRGVPDCGEIT